MYSASSEAPIVAYFYLNGEMNLVEKKPGAPLPERAADVGKAGGD